MLYHHYFLQPVLHWWWDNHTQILDFLDLDLFLSVHDNCPCRLHKLEYWYLKGYGSIELDLQEEVLNKAWNWTRQWQSSTIYTMYATLKLNYKKNYQLTYPKTTRSSPPQWHSSTKERGSCECVSLAYTTLPGCLAPVCIGWSNCQFQPSCW